MNGMTMRDAELKTAYMKIYNKFFLKWKSRGGNLKDEDYVLMIKEMNFIKGRYPQNPFVADLLLTFFHEIEARAHQGDYRANNKLVTFTFNDGFEVIT